MTIGPEPITATVSMSSRLGNRPPSAMRATNRSSASRASCGPGLASGWNCIDATGRSRSSSPSTVPSYSETYVTRAGPKSVSRSPPSSGTRTANPWFWAVTSTRPVSTSSTGWLAPRWPKRSLKVSSPSARPSS